MFVLVLVYDNVRHVIMQQCIANYAVYYSRYSFNVTHLFYRPFSNVGVGLDLYDAGSALMETHLSLK